MSSQSAHRQLRSRTSRSSQSQPQPHSSAPVNSADSSITSNIATPEDTAATSSGNLLSSSPSAKRLRTKPSASSGSSGTSSLSSSGSKSSSTSKRARTSSQTQQQSAPRSSAARGSRSSDTIPRTSKGKGKAKASSQDDLSSPEASPDTSRTASGLRKSPRLSNKRSLSSASISPTPEADSSSSLSRASAASKRRKVGSSQASQVTSYNLRARRSSQSSSAMVHSSDSSSKRASTNSSSRSGRISRKASSSKSVANRAGECHDDDLEAMAGDLDFAEMIAADEADDAHHDQAQDDSGSNEPEEGEHVDEDDARLDRDDEVSHEEHHPDDDDEDDDEEMVPHYDDEMEDEEGFARSGDLVDNLRAMAGYLTGAHSRYRTILASLRSRKNPVAQLDALQELAEALSLSSEDSLAGYFPTDSFVRELIYIMGGPKPPAPTNAAIGGDTAETVEDGEDDDDAETAQILAAAGLVDQGTVTILACRCLANLIEAMPHAAHTVVTHGAVPVLLSKLVEIEFIDLAEQTLQTLEKISVDYPASIVREGGLMAMLQYLDFFNIHIQRTAMVAVSHCCRKLSAEHFNRVRDVMPIIRNVLSYADQRLVESACKCVVRMVESYRHQVDLLDRLLDQELVQALNAHLLQGNPSAAGISVSTSTTIGPSVYTEVLKSLGVALKASPRLSVTLLEASVVETLYHLLTGSTAPGEDGSGGRGPAAVAAAGSSSSVAPAAQLESNDPSTADVAALAVVGQEGNSGDSIAVADMAVLQNLAHRPKEQVQEALNLVNELLPPLPRDGVFDARAYSEKAWIRRRKTDRANREKEKAKLRAVATSSAPQQTNGSSSNGSPEMDMSIVLPSPDEPVKPEKPIKTEKDIIREEAQTRRIEMLSERPQLVKRFTQLLLPTLVEVYAASVALHVRQKVLTGILKIVNFVEPESLNQVLDNVPLASFVASILSSRDDPSLVQSALQLVELLCQRLPNVYKSLLRREGVMWEISDIACQTPVNTKYTTKSPTAATGTSSASQPQTPASRLALPVPTASSLATPSVSAATPAMPTPATTVSSPDPAARLLSSLLGGVAATPVAKKTDAALVESAKDAVIWRARILRDVFNKEAASADGGADHAEKSLLTVKALVTALDESASLDVEHARKALEDITGLFTTASEPISSFELLRSGLVEGLCGFASGDSPQVSAANRRELLLNALTSGSGNGEGGGTLVRRLQESLSRLENVEIATALSSSSDDSRRQGAASLHRQLRLRLQSEDADAPRSCHNLTVGIHAIASFERLSEFLRPKLNAAATVAALGSGASNSARLSSVLAALAGSSESGLRRSSALAAALAGGQGLFASSTTSGGQRDPNASVGSSSSTAAVEPATGTSNSAPRRRSSRLSGKSSTDNVKKEAAEDNEESATVSSESTTSTSADKQKEKDASPSDPAEPLEGAGLAGLAEGSGLTSEEIAQQIMEDLMPDEYDDDDDRSDEEMDPQIFEDELGPGDALGTSPVQDKTVNLSVAADGKNLELNTPHGTRIGTPSALNTPTTGGAAGGASGSSPQRPSYAAALQRKPTDFHLEFSMNGRKLDLDSTIYAAVHHFETSPERIAAVSSGAQSSVVTTGSSFLPRGVWNNVYTIKYKKIEGPAPPKDHDERTPEPGLNGAHPLPTLPDSIAADSPFAKILQLLHILHDLNSEWRATRPGSLANADKAAAISEAAFVNNKLTAKLNRQLEEPMIVASKCLPDWSLQLPREFPFLFPFEARYAFLQSTAFGYNRMLQRWQNLANRSDNNAGSSSRRDTDSLAHLVRLPRAKVRIARRDLLRSAFRVMQLYGKTDTILEVEYFEEVGTGLGPTLEFYALASREFARKDLHMWRDNGPADSKSPYVYTPSGLFPLPISEASLETAQGQSRLSAFKTIGQFVAKALLDSRIIDCNFSPLFMRAVLNQRFTPSLSLLRAVDSTLAKSLESLRSMTSDDLAGLHLDFTLPGDADYELVTGGKSKDVTSDTVDSYVECVVDAVLGRGVRPLVKAFRNGFNQVFPISTMASFTAEELVMLFGNTEEDWSESTLQAAIKPDHGYNSESQTFQDLLSIMASFNLTERREFLQWLTGSPKLPIGGFAGLQPRLTVVKRAADAPLKPDDYLASNMSCANFLKLPQYSTREVMKRRLETAVREGAGSFDLS